MPAAAFLVVVALGALGGTGPADPAESIEGPSTPVAVDENAARTVAGASAAGFVGGMLVAMPTLLSLLPVAGPYVAASVAALMLAGGAAFGAFVGELAYAPIGSSALVAATGAAGALLGLFGGGALGGLLGAAVESQPRGGATAILGALAGGVIGGIAGAAGGGAAGSAWLTPPPR